MSHAHVRKEENDNNNNDDDDDDDDEIDFSNIIILSKGDASHAYAAKDSRL